ncbi:MAG: DNA topoisomerase III [Clostridiales bacterium]|jgi:DNA topoisomerase-3|nr:DNA topoisomerase III [Clostridiales bacterium]
MAKTLVLAEKPSVGKDIARVLGCASGGGGFMEGPAYVVTWALGHLVSLAEPEQYDKKYEKWDMNDLPIIPESMKLEVIGKTSKQYNVVKQLLVRGDVAKIIIATDAGREGELVARWILEKTHVKKPVERLWISSVTDKAIREGFSRLKSGKEYENLFKSAVARAHADWIVGINATRALTAKHNAQLSCGRVQTPTLSMVAKREDEIRNFKPRTFYLIRAKAKEVSFSWDSSSSQYAALIKEGGGRIYDEALCDEILKSMEGKGARVIDVARSEKKIYAPLLYDLTRLQSDANKMYGYSVKDTLSIVQSLYETHKVLTYPRTDSQYLSADIVGTLAERVRACAIPAFRKLCGKLSGAKFSASAFYIDDKKVTDHHAIIPTEQSPSLEKMSDRERRIYELVARRFLAALFPPCEYEQTEIAIAVEAASKQHKGSDREIFRAKGRKIKTLGFREVYENALSVEKPEEEDSQSLPDFAKGEIVKDLKLSKASDKTAPPSYFTEATLITTMENPAKYMESASKDLLKTMDETGGIGTVATRADIIEKLFSSFVIEKRGQDIFITKKGRQLLKLAPQELASPVLTAQWEKRLSRIAQGSEPIDSFLKEIKEYTRSIIGDIKSSSEVFVHDNVTRERCPSCGKFLLDVNGKKGRMLVCADRECGYRQNVSLITNARCPQCHKRLEMIGSGEKKFYACVCGYREKNEAFIKRMEETSNKMNKRDLEEFMRRQEKEAPANNAFAAAFAKLGKDQLYLGQAGGNNNKRE